MVSVRTWLSTLSNAFQNTILDKENFPQQILMLMPDNLPGKYAFYSSKWVEAHKAINGLRQANELFDKDFRSQMAIAGFMPTCDPCVYHKQDLHDPTMKCSIKICMLMMVYRYILPHSFIKMPLINSLCVGAN